MADPKERQAHIPYDAEPKEIEEIDRRQAEIKARQDRDMEALKARQRSGLDRMYPDRPQRRVYSYAQGGSANYGKDYRKGK